MTVSASPEVVRPTIVVVGGGLAGLSASLEAARYAASLRERVQIVVFEKMPALGGNSVKASSGLSSLELASGDTEAVSFEDTIKTGGVLSNQTIVRKLVHESADALHIVESFGVSLSAPSHCGCTRSLARAGTQSAPTWGAVIMSALAAAAQREESIEIMTGTRMLELLSVSTATTATGVEGVSYQLSSDTTATPVAHGTCGERLELPAEAVILATGGFAASPEQLARWALKLAALPSTNGNCAAGDGLLAGLRLGAATIQLDSVQVHPTAIVNPADPDARTKWLAPEAMRGLGGILLDAHTGRRFVDELQMRSVVTAALLARGGRASLVLGEAAASAFGLQTLGVYVKKELASVHAGFSELAKHFGVPEQVLREEANTYGQGRRPGGATADGGVFYSLSVTPALHYCMGGLRIGSFGEVLAELDAGQYAPVPGLFAAGEVTGGVHGENRLAGNSLTECPSTLRSTAH
ncbi:FAD binding domain-containing protein [Pavlovales sp. CCMP2436]|nr:FAD binding domain-containing protein [Pavlovales sp. CCMP2436]